MLDVLTRRIRRGTIRARIKAAYSAEPRVKSRSRWHVSPRGKVTRLGPVTVAAGDYQWTELKGSLDAIDVHIGHGFVGDEKRLGKQIHDAIDAVIRDAPDFTPEES